MSHKKTKKVAQKLLKLDISYGASVQPGFERFKFDCMKYVWPLKDNSVEEAFSAYILGRIPGKERGKWMDELYRVMVPEGKATIIFPYWSSPRAVQDFMFEWPPIVEQSFLYFNKEWRKTNQIEEYPTMANFDFTYGYALEQDVATRSEEVRQVWIKKYLNSVTDIQVVLIKKT